MSYESLEWDSAFFGFAIGRVQVPTPEELAPSVMQADADGIRCLYLLCPAGDDQLLITALAAGFLPYDIRLELDRELGAADALPAEVRRATEGDREALDLIARERFENTRFFADPHFPRSRCRDLYSEWLNRGLTTPPDRVTLTTTDAGGFIICRAEPRSARGVIELVAVAAGRGGAGTGGLLVDAALTWFAGHGLKSSLVVTQGSNLAGQRLYQRHGFRSREVGHWLHRWSSP